MLTKFIERIERENLHVAGICVQQHGKLIAEHRWLADTPHNMFSLSKSFTSTAIGMAVDEGLLCLTDKVYDVIPEVFPEDADENTLKMNLRDLLVMASGHEKVCMSISQTDYILNPDWATYFLSQPAPYVPGSKFVYDTGCTYIAATMLAKVSGQKLVDYLMPRLFEPFGLEKPYWEVCPMGRNLGGRGLYLKTRDLLKFGQMYLQKGVWQDKELVSEDWIKRATSFQIQSEQVGATEPMPDWDKGYGYQFWMCQTGAYRADGKDGQFCIVDDALDSVIAVTANEDLAQHILTAIWETIYPALRQSY